MRARFAAEHHVDVSFEKQLGARYRVERLALETLLAAPAEAEHPLAPGFELLAERSRKIAPIARELVARDASGRLHTSVVDLAPSLLHMHANRMLRSEQRRQELVLYDFLSRLYESELARSRKRR
jgi:thiopeptide-type bacteriocin biosynthesis protein